MIGLDTNVIVRYLAQDDPEQSGAATRLIEQRLSASDRGFVSIVTLAEVAWVMASSYRATRALIANTVDVLLTAPQLSVEQSDVVWRALQEFRESKADFSDALIAELGRDAGCSATVTFDRLAARHPGFQALR